MSVESLLAKLDRVKRVGAGRWVARCAAHQDRTPSLSIAELPDGRVLIHCFVGCRTEDVLAAVGLDFNALLPHGALADGIKREKRPFIPSQVFDIARREIAVAAVIAADMTKARTIAAADYDRLLTAAERLEGIARAAYGR